MDTTIRNQIAAELTSCVERTFERLKAEDTHRPFHRALLSPEALLWSRFERSFSTSFGQSVIERVSKLAALAGGASDAAGQRATTVTLTAETAAAIEAHLTMLRSGVTQARETWDETLEQVRRPPGTGTESIEYRVISDLWFRRDGRDHFLSIKTVKPNIDQTVEAKRDLMKLSLGVEGDPCVYFGLYYNPYGESRAAYQWTPPMKVFDFHNDHVVLIGRDYWDTIGGAGLYDEMLAIAAEVGERTRELISEWARGM